VVCVRGLLLMLSLILLTALVLLVEIARASAL
jgi:hypothetical protein